MSLEQVISSEVLDIRDGTHDSPKYIEEGYPLVTSKNVVDGRVDLSNTKLISKEDLDNINKRSKVDLGDILMPMIGTIGRPQRTTLSKRGYQRVGFFESCRRPTFAVNLLK